MTVTICALLRGSTLLYLPVALLSFSACSGDDGGGRAPTPQMTTGATLTSQPPARLYAADAGDRAGAVAAGDFNADGTPDIAVAAAFADGPQNSRIDGGEVYIFAGPFQPGEVRDAAAGGQDLTIFGAASGDQAGRALATADFNGDGIDDLVIGSPSADGPSGDRADSGRVNVVFGARELGEVPVLDLAAGSAFTMHGASAGDLAGFALGAGNLNGDEAEDLVVGAFFAAGPGDLRPLAGETYVIYGSDLPEDVMDLSLQAADVTVYGAASNDRLGEGVASGDVDGDGTDDLVLPAPFALNLAGERDAGQTYVLTSPLLSSIDLSLEEPGATIYGVDDGDQLGHVTAVGDLDADGRADILLTAVSADGPGDTVDLAGEAAVVLSRSLKPEVDVAAGGADSVIYGSQQEGRLGRSGAIADLNGDGSAEILLGAPGEQAANGSARGGSLYAISGSDLPSEAMTGRGRIYKSDEGEAALATEVYGRMPIAATDLDGVPGSEVIVTASGGDGPDGRRVDCGYALILFISQ
jgi:hypothetical protein